MTSLSRYRNCGLRTASMLCVVLLSGTFAACGGLKFWEREKYFRTELQEGFVPDSVHTIGIYVFSQGSAQNGLDVPYDGADIADNVVSTPAAFITLGTVGYWDKRHSRFNIHKNFFPPEVDRHLTMEPDSSNVYPSFALAEKIRDSIKAHGFDVMIIEDMNHSGEVTVEQCLRHAQSKGYEGAFIVYYTGLNKWMKLKGATVHRDWESRWQGLVELETFNGFLYLANAALFDTRTQERVWANSHYGLIERAHLPNLQSEPFIEVVPEAIVYNGDVLVEKAAANTTSVLFDPPYWKGSFHAFPSRTRRKKM